ncbi:MAG: gamma-glutamylcyclotransferase family protein [Mucilaginibacter sp.]
MDVLCLYLFVYGTLLDADNEFAIFMRKHCQFVKKGKFKGRLYDIGEYPGAIEDTYAESYIHGSIYLMNNAPMVLKTLDDYEGYGPEQEQPNLFIRKLIEIETDARSIDCWVYLYNRPVGTRI